MTMQKKPLSYKKGILRTSQNEAGCKKLLLIWLLCKKSLILH